MRRFLLLSTATFLCCGYSTFASAQNLLVASPKLAPRLILTQTDGSSEAQSSSDSVDDEEEASAKPSPFDLFSNEPTSAGNQEADHTSNNQTESSEESAATPVGRHHRQPSPADTIIAGAQVAANNGYFPPIDMVSHMRHAPNHTADYMLQQWCADGLWDNYSAERAAQCARQAQRIAGRSHCGHCGHAGSCGQPGYFQQPTCVGGHCGSRGHFGHGSHLRQARPIEQSRGGCGMIGGYGNCDDYSPQCDQAALNHAQAGSGNGLQPQSMGRPQYAQTATAPVDQSAPSVLPSNANPSNSSTQSGGQSGKVAVRPLNVYR